MTGKFTYAYPILNEPFIKVGEGLDPFGRMIDYCNYHGLNPDISKLIESKVLNNAKDVEGYIHNKLISIGCIKVDPNNTGAIEVFKIPNGYSIDDILI